ncbi:MAG: hypothetical protein LBL82_05455 [Oscillospiraceae bacterium]|jgi:hypothetical protein|nr:hypothetical protein [Oscillospiraceae bacterium]
MGTEQFTPNTSNAAGLRKPRMITSTWRPIRNIISGIFVLITSVAVMGFFLYLENSDIVENAVWVGPGPQPDNMFSNFAWGFIPAVLLGIWLIVLGAVRLHRVKAFKKYLNESLNETSEENSEK